MNTEFENRLKELEALASTDAQASLARVREGAHRRGLFIDCGSNVGQGFTQFSRSYPLAHYDYILVEPNPNCVPRLRQIVATAKGCVRLIEQAAGIGVGEVSFYGIDASRPTSEGGSTLKEHNSAYYAADEGKAFTVPTFSLAQLIRDSAGQYDSIVLKLDIEGGEYEVLDDMIRKDAHRALDFAYVEFHSQYMSEPWHSKYQPREDEFIQRFESDGVAFRRWV
jgi:FkbM family methyltransferase